MTDPVAAISCARVVSKALTCLLVGLLTACGSSHPATSGDDRDTAPAASPAGADITGAGATFIYPLISKWSSDYHALTGARINYQSIGSGGGIAQIKAGTVDFGSSDKPLSSAELDEAGLMQFPSAIGGVVPVVNLPGVAAGQMRLTGPLLADMLRGKVAKWNDPAIAALNPGLPLPDRKISVVHRSDGSGTTYNFTHYLSQVSPGWKSDIGEGTSVMWPTGIGGKGNEGVAAYVRQLKGSVGYVELAYASGGGLAYVSLRNAAGHWVQPSVQSFQAAADGADWAGVQDFSLVITNAPGEQAWPITATNFILMHRQPKDPARARKAREFFAWALQNGRPQAEALHFVPLPPRLVQQVQAYWTGQDTP